MNSVRSNLAQITFFGILAAILGLAGDALASDRTEGGVPAKTCKYNSRTGKNVFYSAEVVEGGCRISTDYDNYGRFQYIVKITVKNETSEIRVVMAAPSSRSAAAIDGVPGVYSEPERCLHTATTNDASSQVTWRENEMCQ